MENNISAEQVQNYIGDYGRRYINTQMKVKAYEHDTIVTLDDVIRQTIMESEVMPVTYEQLCNAEKLEVGHTTKFSIFNIKRIS